MKKLHTLLRQHIPQITFLETETDELAEGECALWSHDDCTLIIEFEKQNFSDDALTSALQHIAQKLAFLDTQHDAIVSWLQSETQSTDLLGARVVYVACFVEDAQNVFCDFAVSAQNWGDKMAECALEEDNELIFNGIN